ncbi:MAG TPA: sigma 54-interacting transcriptional regulator [Kofleriaceae bacterium]|nr:sigma 54-interacting transcriptional regulator [Kofleriaceae bacterium]
MIRGRYEVLRRLGEGGGGSVYEVRDTLAGDAHIALKALWPGAHDEALVAALRAEFGTLATLRHPRLCRVFDFGRLPPRELAPEMAGADGDRHGFFLTRELVAGNDLSAAAKQRGHDLREVCVLLADAARGLEVLHRSGLRHGDFKPANAIASEHAPDTVRLIDFGLSVAETAHRSAGTLVYMAPEVLTGRAIDRRADLYALGITLYELATGTLPCGSARGADLIAWHVSGDRPRLEDAVRQVPPQLARLCGQLMARSPEDRLPTAGEVAAALTACAIELGANPREGVPEPIVGPALPLPQVAALERAFEHRRRRRGGPALVHVIGDAGAGKSTALTELAWRAELAGAEVVRGASAAHGRPLGVFGAALEQLAALTGQPAPGTDQAGSDQRRFAEVAAWLAEQSRRWPIVLLLDDLDFGDSASQDLARYLAFALPDEARVLVIASRRPTSASQHGDPRPSRVGDVPELFLAPLDAAQVRMLLTHVSGRDDEALADRIHRHTGGNLLHVTHTLHVLAGRGFPSSESLEAFGLPARLEEELTAALAHAPASVRDLVESLAIVARPCTADDVAAMLGRSTTEVRALAEQSPLVTQDAAGRLLLGRPSSRLAVDAAMSAERRRELHRTAAAVVAGALDADDPERIAHAIRGGITTTPVAHITAALARLRAANDLATALPLGRAALELIDSSVPLRLEVGEAARAAGDLRAAHHALAPLLEVPATDESARRARYLVACAAEAAGEPDRAVTLWGEAIEGSPGSADAALSARELSRLEIKRGRAAAALEVADRALAETSDAEVRPHLEVARAFALGTLGRDDDAAARLDELGEAARHRGDHALAATAHNYAALLAFRRSEYQLTRTRYQRALEAAIAHGDLVRVGTLRMNIASLAFHKGDYAGCLEQHVAAVSLLRAAGAETSVVMARRNLGHLFVELGAYQQARAELHAARDTAATLGLEVHVNGIEALLGIADCRTGERRAGFERLERGRRGFEALGDSHRAIETLLDAVEAALDLGEVDRAAATIELTGAAEGGGRNQRARYLAARAEVCARRDDVAGARRDLAALEPLIDELAREGARHALWTLHRAAWRTLGAISDHAAGATHQRRAATILEELSARLPDAYRAAFRHDPRRRALQEMHEPTLPDARRTTAPGQASPSSGPVQVDRLYRLLEIYRRLSGERDVDRLLVLVMDTAVELSGSERGFLLLAEKDGALRTAVSRNIPHTTLRALAAVDSDPTRSSMTQVPYSRTIAERAFHTGEPIFAEDPQGDPRFDEAHSVHALHLESVVCLPVSAGGERVGVLYLESRFRTQAYADADARLLLAFADQAGILLGNARLLEENRRRAADLERARVEIEGLLAERTALLEDRTQELAATRRDLATVRRRFLGDRGAFGIIGHSAAMENVFELIERLAPTDVPVMVLGESGTGKELVARALHEYGPRKDAPMVAVNCGALPEHLLESELFGHVRGAFTGAERDRRGLFETASGGTLFLDEMGDTPPRMQATLLRALQEGVIRRVGGLEDIRVDVRVVAATNRDLEQMVAVGEFREDLYYRLHVVSIPLPPLRERADDVPLLAEHFLELACRRSGLPAKTIGRQALRRLMQHPWPGNVRQLEHAMTNAAVLAEGDELGESDFGAVLGQGQPRRARPQDPEHRRDREKERIIQALEGCGWNKSKAARMLQIPRRTFYRRLQEFGIE